MNVQSSVLCVMDASILSGPTSAHVTMDIGQLTMEHLYTVKVKYSHSASQTYITYNMCSMITTPVWSLHMATCIFSV